MLLLVTLEIIIITVKLARYNNNVRTQSILLLFDRQSYNLIEF